jgi:hypothetical protein
VAIKRVGASSLELVPPEPPLLERDLNRRQFIRTAGVAAGVAAGSGLWGPFLSSALADGSKKGLPKHIPGGIRIFGPGTRVFHLFPPIPGYEPSTITDFDGVVGAAAVKGFGTAENGQGEKSRRPFDVDMRFMQGRFIDRAGGERHGTFAFI